MHALMPFAIPYIPEHTVYAERVKAPNEQKKNKICESLWTIHWRAIPQHRFYSNRFFPRDFEQCRFAGQKWKIFFMWQWTKSKNRSIKSDTDKSAIDRGRTQRHNIVFHLLFCFFLSWLQWNKDDRKIQHQKLEYRNVNFIRTTIGD